MPEASLYNVDLDWIEIHDYDYCVSMYTACANLEAIYNIKAIYRNPIKPKPVVLRQWYPALEYTTVGAA